MNLFTFFAAADSGLGRINPSMLTDQSRLEIAVDCVNNKGLFTDESGDYRAISTWGGLIFSEDNLRVTDFLITGRDNGADALGGSIAFSYLPDSMEEISLKKCGLTGTFSTHDLPTAIDHLA